MILNTSVARHFMILKECRKARQIRRVYSLQFTLSKSEPIREIPAHLDADGFDLK
jgi:hypothetical protein